MSVYALVVLFEKPKNAYGGYIHLLRQFLELPYMKSVGLLAVLAG